MFSALYVLADYLCSTSRGQGVWNSWCNASCDTSDHHSDREDASAYRRDPWRRHRSCPRTFPVCIYLDRVKSQLLMSLTRLKETTIVSRCACREWNSPEDCQGWAHHASASANFFMFFSVSHLHKTKSAIVHSEFSMAGPIGSETHLFARCQSGAPSIHDSCRIRPWWHVASVSHLQEEEVAVRMEVVEGCRTEETEGGTQFRVSATSLSAPIYLVAIEIDCPLIIRSAVVLISNQATRSSQLEEWKKKISLVASAVSPPCLLYFLTCNNDI